MSREKTSFSGLDSFYLAVHAHKSYHDGVLKVDGPNFMTIELDRGDSVIHDDGDVWFHSFLITLQLPLRDIEEITNQLYDVNSENVYNIFKRINKIIWLIVFCPNNLYIV